MTTQPTFSRWKSADLSTLTPKEVYSKLGITPQGLTTEEAMQRSSQYGLNEYVPRARRRRLLWPLQIAVRPMLLPLWAAAVLTAVIGRTETTLALLFTVGLSTLVAVLQERKSERAALRLREALPVYSRVLRDGSEHMMPVSQIVPGDILPLTTGDILPADVRMVAAQDVQVTNRALFGDAPPRRALPDGMLPDELTSELPPSIVFAGSRVISGTGQAVVFATGLDTAYGRLATMTATAHEAPSPLMVVLQRLGFIVLPLAVLGSLAAAFVGWQRQLDTSATILLVAAFLVAVVPAGLLPGVIVVLLAGRERLQRAGASIRRLSSVETLGATTVICTDTTGTLTQNEITARELWTAAGSFTLSGVGYEPVGECRLGERVLAPDEAQRLLGPVLRAAVLTATARLLPPDTRRPHWHIVGDPVQAAQLVAAKKLGFDPSAIYELITELALLARSPGSPFDGVLVTDSRGATALLHGAPSLLDHCAALAAPEGDRPLTEQDQQAIWQVVQHYQQAGMQVTLFARAAVQPEQAYRTLSTQQLAHDMVLLGLIGTLDPPRPELEAALADLRAAGIRTIMLTSDDVVAAELLARRCGLNAQACTHPETGATLHGRDHEELWQRLRSGDAVLAQMAADQKLQVVEALDRHGEIVVATGAAATDVPAIKAADIGLAFAQSGSSAAREVADVVLDKDNLATLAEAIMIGRTVEQQVRRLIAINLGATALEARGADSDRRAPGAAAAHHWPAADD